MNEGVSLLDDVMYEIPGNDNVPEMLQEDAFQHSVYDPRYTNLTTLNTGYYHRYYKTSNKGAMGLERIYRGFSDEFLFVAETTQPQVASEHYEHCVKRGRRCSTSSSRFTYAIPLEIIYLSPLYKWNPYKIPVWDRDTVRADDRNGQFTEERAFNGSSDNGYYFLTPLEFYADLDSEKEDPADTQSTGVGVLDKNGVVRRVVASGTRIFTLEIPDIGRIRMRYPIMPIHGEGSSVWKELNVVKKMLKRDHTNGTSPAYLVEMRPTTISGLHTHTFYLTPNEWEILMTGASMTVSTSVANGHEHELVISMNRMRNAIKYSQCDGSKQCWDKHDVKLRILEKPTLDLEF